MEKNKTKNNEIKRKALIISSALIISATSLVGVAYAKYITKVSGKENVSIAKWSFQVNGENEGRWEANLGITEYDASKISNGKIAPGTSGTFDITIDARGTETGVDYVVRAPEWHFKPANLYFKIGDTRYDSLSEVANALSGSFAANDTNKLVTKQVQWIWDYQTTDNGRSVEENDQVDTWDGQYANDFNFVIEVIGTQTNPA